MSRRKGVIEGARGRLGETENALIDDLLACPIDRRTFLQHGSRLGLGLALLNTLAAAAGLGLAAPPATAPGMRGGSVRAAVAMPHGAIDPLLVNDSGSYQLIFQVAEFLCITQPDLTLKPVLAGSWSHNAGGPVWTFKLRRGARFHDGRGMTSADAGAALHRPSRPAR